MSESNRGDIYKELGATPIINAIGSVTMLGGSTPTPEVRAAMERAGDSYIPLMELEEKALENEPKKRARTASKDMVAASDPYQ